MLTESERKIFEYYYNKISGKADRLAIELHRLLNSAEEVAAFIYMRRALEIILMDICEIELNRPMRKDGLLKELDRLKNIGKTAEIIPEHIVVSMKNINSLGTFGAHPKEFNPKQLREAFSSLDTVIEWYAADYKSIKMPRSMTGEKTPSSSILTSNPYVGLDPFQEEDASLFLGRERIIEILWEKFRSISEKQSVAFLPVSGPSGSGKSSLVRAGLIPRLKKELKSVKILTIKPGRHPIDSLYSKLLNAWGGDHHERIHPFVSDMKTPPFHGLRKLIGEISDGMHLVVVIDPFEEIYTLCKEKEERTAFIENLLHAAYPNGPLTILITCRSNFLNQTNTHPKLNRIISEERVRVSMMNEDELHRCIARPAEAAGKPFNEFFIEMLIEQTQGRKGALPLLQLALHEVWEGVIRGVDPEKTLEKMGGVGGVCTKKAEEIYDDLSENEKRAAKRLFLSMVQFEEGFRCHSRRVRISDMALSSEEKRNTLDILDRFSNRDVRLITLSCDFDGYETAEITHEALLKNWPVLKEWIESSRDTIRFERRLAEAAGHWDDCGRPKGLLWQEPDLSLLRDHHSTHCVDMTELQLQFFRASHQKQQQGKWIKRSLVAILSVLVVALGVSSYHLSKNKKEIQSQLAMNYWRSSRQFNDQHQNLKSLHLSAAAWRTNPNKLLDKNLQMHLRSFWPQYQLKAILTHGGPVTGIQLSADKKRLLTWGDDGAVKIWDCNNWKQLAKSMRHQGPVNGAVFSKNETRVLSWGKDGTARLWRLHDRKPGPPMHHEREIYGAMFSKDGTRVLTWSYDDTACLWNPDSGEKVIPPLKHKRLSGAVITDDDTTIVTWGFDNTVRFWDADSGDLKAQPLVLDGWVNGLRFTKDQTAFLIWTQAGTMTLRDARTGNRITGDMKHKRAILGAVFNRNEKRILSWGEDGTVRLWASDTGRALYSLPHGSRVNGAVFNADETRILSWAADGSVYLWNAETGEKIGGKISVREAVYGAGFCNNETQLLIWGKAGTAQIWDLTTRRPAGTELMHDSPIVGALTDDARIITYGKDGAVRVWAKGGDIKPDVRIRPNGGVAGGFLDAENRKFVSWNPDGVVYVWNADTGKRICETTEGIKEINGAALFNSGKKCLTWSRKGGIRIWNVETGKPIGAEMIHQKVTRAQVIQDGKRILSWGGDGAARLWDAATGQQIGLTMVHNDSVNGALFDAARNIILTYSTDGTARLWNADTCEPVGIILKHKNVISGAAFFDSGKKILTWSIDGAAALWNAETGRLIGSKMRHDDWITGAHVRKDGARIVTWGKDLTLKIWNALGEQVGVTLVFKDTIPGAIFNAEQSRIIAWSKDGTVRVADTATGKDTGIILSHQEAVAGVALNRDGTRLITWDADGFIYAWDIVSGLQTIPPIWHGSQINGVMYRHKQSQILSWGQNREVSLWDARTGENIGTSLSLRNSVLGAAFSPDGKKLFEWDHQMMVIREIASGAALSKATVERQIHSMTGTRFDPQTQMVRVLMPDQWRKMK